MSDEYKDLLSTIRSRLDTAVGALSDSREDELDDLRFAAGSPDNNWQWPDEVMASRSGQDDINVRPCLTINKLPQHIHQVTNDQRQNRPSGKVIPANDGAAIEVAEVYEGMVRHIEQDSNADVAYDTACENQVTYGEGYWRLITEYESEDSFDQKIKIKRIRNSFSVYLDPMIQDPCGEDAKWGIITEDLTKAEYLAQYPDAMPISSLTDAGVGDQSVSPWMDEDTVRIAEYFCFEDEPRTLNLYPDNHTAFDGTPEDGVYRKHYGHPIKTRQSAKKQVKWYKTNGYEILEEKKWPGKYIPIIRVIGNEFEVEGRLYVSGIVRNAKDAQRMFNYWSSQEAEMLALAPKAPFIGAAGQFEGFEDHWKTANTSAWAYLEYNPDVTDGAGNALPPPQRSQPPMVQSGLIAAKNAASEDIKEATGQYNASLGQTSNERSGKAILARQHEGDVSTFHYVDNLARAIRYSTRQIIDLVPKIYDRPGRIARVLGEDGESKTVKFDSTQTVPVVKKVDQAGTVIEMIYNPDVGMYDVLAVSGPGYATKRQEALESMATLIQGYPELWKIAGDIFVKNMDWPGAQQLSKRFQKIIDPKILQDGDEDPALQQAQQQIQQLNGELQQAHGMLQNAQKSIEVQELALKKREVDIKAYAAETDRIKVTQVGMTSEQVHDIAAGTVDAALQMAGQMPVNPDAQQPAQEPQQAAPPLDPNKMMVEDSKHALQAQQHDHELKMAQLQAQQQPVQEG